MDPFYDIYSAGQLIEGANPAETRAALARLFKTSEDKIAHLIAGKPQLIKRRVEKAEALRYKATLNQAGLLVSVKISDNAAATQPSAEPKTPHSQPTSTTANSEQSNYSFTLAPPGSDVLQENEKTSFEKREIDTSAIKLAPTFFIAETVTKATVTVPDTSHLILAEAGSMLGSADEKIPVAAPDVSHISVAEVGASLDELKPDTTPLNPDISNLSLAETGVDLVPEEYRKPAPPPAPSTDHIQLEK